MVLCATQQPYQLIPGKQPELEIRHADARTAVIDGPATAELDDELIEAVMGRLDETSGFSAELRALLSMMPLPGAGGLPKGMPSSPARWHRARSEVFSRKARQGLPQDHLCAPVPEGGGGTV